MKAIIRPSGLKGAIQAPVSKSSMQRACAAALLHNGKTIIHNPGHSNDDKAALRIIEALGASVTHVNETVVIESNGTVNPKVVDGSAQVNCGESGLSIRMFTPVIALSGTNVTINGEGSLTERPMDFFDELLPELGVKVQSRKGKLPLQVQGPLQPKNITIDGPLSSQFLTGLLMAYSAALSSATGDGSKSDDITISVKDLKSKPYIDLTLDVMKQFGCLTPSNNNYEEFKFEASHFIKKMPANNQPAIVHYQTEADWSGGAFLLVAGIIAGPVTIRGLDPGSTQADKAILDALMTAGAGVAIEAKGIKLHPSALYAFEFDATDCPDLFPPLAVLAAYCGGTTRIKGVSRLTHKESNRALTLQEEFAKMGVRIDLDDDIMIIHGGNTINGAKVHSRHDHRIAMACAILALGAEGETLIEDAEAVNKSYPDFYDDLEKLGASVSLNNKIRLHE